MFTNPSPFLALTLGTSLLVALGCGGETNGEKSTGSGGGGGSGGSGAGTGGDGGKVPVGEPIDVPNEDWTFVPIEGARCVDGSATGVGLNKTNASENIVIFLQGGNACFTPLSCLITANTGGYREADFAKEKQSFLDVVPLFQRTKGALLADYNFVYVPYCTGDVHAGDNDTTVGTARAFHGANNMNLVLSRLLGTFPKAKRIVLTGVSAGGFGAAFNYDRVARAFGDDVEVILLDDSGPPMGEKFVPKCLQKLFVETWGLAKTMPQECTDCIDADGVFMEPFMRYVATKYPKRRFGLISSTEDGTISSFWSLGDDNCKNVMGVPMPGAYPGSRYEAGLADLRDRIREGADNVQLFQLDGSDGTDKAQHVWLNGDLEATSSHGVTLADWIRQMLSGSEDWVSVPAK